MAVVLTPGEIYFIQEIDPVTKKFTSYVKVGLVREVEGRDSASRLDEHQTGNPRTLHLHKVVKTTAVAAVEGLLHGLYAPYRVHGEWFDFDNKTLTSCINRAEELAKEAKANLKYFEKAESLKGVLSTKPAKKATSKAEDFFTDYKAAKFALDEIGHRISKIKQLYVEAAESGEDVDGLVETIERKQAAKLDVEALLAAYPKLRKKYTEITKTISPRFKWAPFENDLDSLNFLGDNVDDLIFEADKAIAVAKKSKKRLEDLKEIELQLIEYYTAAEWQAEVAEVNIRTLCGDAEGIEGICTWKRVEKVTEKFNEKKFKAENPELFQQFSTGGGTTVAHKAKRNRK